jgi:hypothetical protein
MAKANPAFFKKRLSEKLLETTKQALDELGNYEHLKKELDQAIEPNQNPKKEISNKANKNNKGLVI